MFTRNCLMLLAAMFLCSCSSFWGVSKPEAEKFIAGEEAKAKIFASQTTILNNLLTQVQASGVPAAQTAPIQAAADQNAASYAAIDDAQMDVLGELIELDYKALWKKFRDGLVPTAGGGK